MLPADSLGPPVQVKEIVMEAMFKVKKIDLDGIFLFFFFFSSGIKASYIVMKMFKFLSKIHIFLFKTKKKRTGLTNRQSKL